MPRRKCSVVVSAVLLGNEKHTFEKLCRENGVDRTLAKMIHLQTSGNVRGWFGMRKQFKPIFAIFGVYIFWHNDVKSHKNLDDDN
jgi:hypothetical protein